MRAVFLHVARIAGCLLALSAALHALRHFGVLPAYLPGGDVEPLVVAYQSAAAGGRGSENIILTGDSSCLMDVSVPEFEKQSAGKIQAVDLGTLSYLPLRYFGELASQRVSASGAAGASPHRGQVVVLLINPEMLTSEIDPNTAAQAADLIGRESRCSSQEPILNCVLGLQILRDHILSHLHPVPLAGAYRNKYGFNRDLYAFMRAQKGGLVDPNSIRLNVEKNRHWKMTSEFRNQAQHFREILPPQTRLLFGLTPIPKELRGKNFEQEYKLLLDDAVRLLKPDALLDLPASYPGAKFATATHLNEQGRKQFSRTLAEVLERALASPPEPTHL